MKELKEIALIAAILGELFTDNIKYKTYLETIDLVSDWAIDFHNKYKDVNWEEITLSINPHPDFPEATSWDDMVRLYGNKRFNELL